MRRQNIFGEAHPFPLPARLRCMLSTIAPMTDSEDLAELLARLRPRLHRYCARMAGSALDGEDIVQEALAKVAMHYDPAVIERPEAWMFRVAHNATMDFLRRRALDRGLFADADADDAMDAVALQISDPVAVAEATSAALATFMHLPASQRSAVILADVLDHALQEIAELLDTTVPAVKAALHRGRTRLRHMANEPLEKRPQRLSPEAQAMARLYAERFNARDFDGLRALLAEDVKLDLAGRLQLRGKDDVSVYFGNYAKLNGLRAVPGGVEGAPGLWVHEGAATEPAYAIVLESRDGQLTRIRDFRYARYVSDALREPQEPIRPVPQEPLRNPSRNPVHQRRSSR